MKKNIFISGMGIICSAGNNLKECLESIYKGSRNYSHSQRVITDHEVPFYVYEVNKPFEMEQQSNLFRTTQLAIEATTQAIYSAGYSLKELSKKRVGVCMGTSVGCMLNNESFYKKFLQGKNKDYQGITRFLNNNLCEQIASFFKLTGPKQTIVNACSSGTDAIGIASSWLQNDLCDIVIAGGADELSKVTLNGFSSLLIANPKICKPFDKNRQGLNLGEGAGVIILEKQTKNKPLGKILEYRSYADSYHLTKPEPTGKGLRIAIKKALEYLKIKPHDISYINAHGTGTHDNDLIEGKLISDLFPNTPFNSTKGYTGHTLGASGGIEAILTLSFLNSNLLPKSAGFEIIDPEINLSPILKNTPIDSNQTIAISQSIAFGGNNSLIVIGKCI